MKHLTLYLLFGAILLMAACADDPAGTLDVYALNQDGPQAGVSLKLDPGGASAVTDTAGLATFSDLPPLDYLIAATHPELGENTALVSVRDEETAAVYLYLPGRYNQPPEVSWLYPTPDYDYDVRQDEIWHLTATIRDDRDAEGTVSYSVNSDLDGPIVSGLDSAGYLDRRAPVLSVGTHTLTLTATDSEGRSQEASVVVTVEPGWPSLTLFEPTAEGDGLRIRWSAWPAESFASYSLLRYTPNDAFLNTIAVFENRQDTVFLDRTVPFNKQVEYAVQVRYKPEYDYHDEVRSETLFTELRYGRIDLESPIYEILSDPKRNLLYGADRENDRVVVMDVATKAVTGYVTVGSQPEDLALSPNGDSLFVANSGSNSVSVIDLATTRLARTITLPPAYYGLRFLPERIAALSDGRLAFVSSTGVTGLWLYRPKVDTLTYVTRTTVALQNFAVAPDHSTLYVTENGGGGQQVERYVSTADGNLRLEQSSEPGNGGPRCVLSGDGRYVFFANRKLDARDLRRVLVTFPDPYDTDIRLSNYDGSRAMGQYFYYDGETGAAGQPVRESTYVLSYDPVRSLSFHHTRYTKVVTVIPFP